MSLLFGVTPYKKMKDGLLKCTVIPHITDMLSELMLSENNENDETQEGNADKKMSLNIQKSLLLCFSASAELLCPLIQSEEFDNILAVKSKSTNFVKWLLTDLHENSVKKSFEAIETLTSISKEFPSLFIDYWDEVKEFINIQFSINESKKTHATLKMIEQWINSISNIYYKLTKGSQNTDELEDVKLDDADLITNEAINQQLDQYDILKLEGWSKLLNKYLTFFIKSVDMDVKNTVCDILWALSEKQWETIFTYEERSKISDQVLEAKIPKVNWSKYIGHAFLNKIFYQDMSLISKMIEKVYKFKDEKSLQLALRNSWSLGNLWQTYCYDEFSVEDKTKVIELWVHYSNKKFKDKIIAHSVRAVGKIFANNSNFEWIEEIKTIDWKDLFNIIIDNINHKSPKVSWNSWVLIRIIMNNDYVRDKIQDLLFSKDTIQRLWQIIRENANFKTRIHAVQTLNKFRLYHDFGEWNLDVWDAFLTAFQNVTSTTDFTEVKYISTLELQLVSLFVTLVQMVESNKTLNEKFSIFLSERAREIETSITDYLRKQFNVTAFSAVYEAAYSAVYDKELNISDLYNDRPFLQETLKQLQIAFHTIVDIIDSSGDISLPFSVYESFNSLAKTPIDEFASLDILRISKSAFDKDQF